MNVQFCSQFVWWFLLIFSVAMPSAALAADKVTESKNASTKALSELQQRIEALKKELESAQSAQAEAADQLKQSERAISESNRKLLDLHQQQSLYAVTLQAQEQQKQALQAKLQQQQDWLKTQLYQQYVHGKQSYAQIVLQQQDPGAVSRQLQYYTYVARARSKRIADMRLNLEEIAKLSAETKATLDEIIAIQTQQEKERQTLQSQRCARESVNTAFRANQVAAW